MADIESKASDVTSKNSFVKCEICNITLSSEMDLEIHKQGKKHLKIEKAFNDVQELKLPPLNNKISNIKTTSSAKNDKLKCEICNISVPSELELESHKHGRKHLKMVNSSKNIAEKQGKQVYICKLGNLTVQDVQSYLSQYGTIVNVSPKTNDYGPKDSLHSAIVEFENKDQVSDLLAQKIKHKVPLSSSNPPRYQNILVFERKFKERPKSPPPSPCPSVEHSEVKLRLSLLTDCSEQVEALVEEMKLVDHHVNDRKNICINIQKTFCREYPGCVVYPFGSSVNGLGFRGCDLDVYIDLGLLPPPAYLPTNPLLDVPVTLTEKQKVHIATRLLRSIPHCSQITPITQARVPIVKFVHRTSGIHCDISFKNRASVCNTQFIWMCNQSDPRIRPLMMTVRYFAKRYDLAGGGGGMKMSNYALTMMTIFYLQQLEFPLLHPVSAYQKCPGVEEDLISGWNCAFTRDPTQLPPLPINSCNILELLAGFFAFFANFNFKELVICPLLGRSVPRTELIRGQLLPYPLNEAPQFTGKDGLKLDKPICLQDPFELSHNVCKNLPMKALQILKIYFQEAKGLCEAMLKPDTSPAGGILSLFGLEISVPDEDESSDNDSVVALSDQVKNCLSRHKFIVQISFPQEFVKNEENHFRDKSVELVRKIFRDCLKFEMRKTEDNTAIDANTSPEISEKNGCDTEAGEAGLKRSISKSSDDSGESKKRLKSTDEIAVNEDENSDNTNKLFMALKCQDDSTSQASNAAKEEVDDVVVDKYEGVCDASNAVGEEVDDAVVDKYEGLCDSSNDVKEEVDDVVGDKYEGVCDASNAVGEEDDSKVVDKYDGVCDEWTVWTPVWARRKKIKSQLSVSRDSSAPGTSAPDIIQTEAEISEKILNEVFGGERLSEPEVVFQAYPIFNKIEDEPPVYQRCLWLGLEVVSSRKKTYETMFDWLGSYLPNIVNEITELGETKEN